MIQLTHHMHILVAIEPIDFRKGIDGIAAVCRNTLKQDPFTGTVFVFRNKRATAVKILIYDGQGFWLCQKRLSKGSFVYWPSKSTDKIDSMQACQLTVLLSGGNPDMAQAVPFWRQIKA